jgi:hypothetical protein
MKTKKITIIKQDDRVELTTNNVGAHELYDILSNLVNRIPEDLFEEPLSDDELIEKHGIAVEDIDDLKKQSPDTPSFDEAYESYKKCKRIAKETFEENGIKVDTIPDSFGKVMSILESDGQIRDDMLRLLAGYVTYKSATKTNLKKKKK